MINKDLKKRIIEIAYKNKLGHLGSYMSCVDIMDWIFKTKAPEDIFILSNGHASLAQYVILEKYYKVDAEMLFNKHGGHPHLDEENHIYCSTGSLGMGIAAAVGRALANPNRTVHVMLSDGECAEGVVWESLRFIADHPVKNIKIYIVHNGYGAYCKIPFDTFQKRIIAFSIGNIALIHDTQKATEEFPFLHDQNAHYKVMKEEDYKIAMELLK
jgi:transketolase